MLPHAEHSVPETAAWDWDLRPLARGEPAVPLAVSGRDGVLPATSVVRSEVELGAEGLDDQAIVSEMLHGVSDDSGCQRGTPRGGMHTGHARHHRQQSHGEGVCKNKEGRKNWVYPEVRKFDGSIFSPQVLSSSPLPLPATTPSRHGSEEEGSTQAVLRID